MAAAWAERIRPPAKMDGHSRMEWLCGEIYSYISNASLVLVEGPSYGSSGSQGFHEGAGLWWLVTHRLWKNGFRTAIVPPKTRAKYATGNGGASKDAVFAAAIRRYKDVDFDGNDAADALILAAMGADYLGHPLAIVPKVNRAALDAIEWPENLVPAPA